MTVVDRRDRVGRRRDRPPVAHQPQHRVGPVEGGLAEGDHREGRGERRDDEHEDDVTVDRPEDPGHGDGPPGLRNRARGIGKPRGPRRRQRFWRDGSFVGHGTLPRVDAASAYLR